MIQLSIGEIIEATKGIPVHENHETYISGISTDSRKTEHGHIFVPLKGENFDGHDFISAAFEKGAAAALTQRETVDFQEGVMIKVEDTLKALQDLAAYYRKRFDIPFTGITGSVGKTSTKEMVACALGARYNVLKNEGNLNNEIGVPLTVFRLDAGHEAAVVEMGMSGIGEIRTLTNIVRPKVGIITNIGISHIEKLGTRQNILKAKLELLEGLQPDGLLILNGDDVLLSGAKGLLDVRSVSYGLEEGVDYRACNVRSRGENGIDFDIMLDGMEYAVHVPAPGVHNVYNALAALAAGHELNIPLEELIKGIARYSPGSMRLNIMKVRGITIINDVYNSSPQSVRAALDVLDELDAVRRIVVLGDMLELGDWSISAHTETGMYLSEKRTDLLITVGKDASYIAKGAVDTGFPPERTASLENNTEAVRCLRDVVKQGDAVLVKGSRGMMMEEIVNGLIS